MYRIYSAAFSGKAGSSEIGITLFSRIGSNYSYIAETNNYYNITQFVPILDTDQFRLVPVSIEQSLDVGDACPIPSISSVCGFVCETADFYLRHSDELQLERDHLFQLQLASVIATPSEAISTILTTVRDAYMASGLIADRWLRIESVCRSASEFYWASLDKDDEQKTWEELKSLGIETVSDALYWLRRNANFRSEPWIRVWGVLQRISPFNNELRDVSASWVNVVYSDLPLDDVVKTPSFIEILAFVCELSRTNHEIEEISDVLIDIAEEYPDYINYLVNSRISYVTLLKAFSENGHISALEHTEYYGRLKGYSRNLTRTGI